MRRVTILKMVPALVAALCGSLLASLSGAAAPLARIAPDKKLIEWGWDEPGPAYMRANAARMDEYGFDGVIFHAEPARNGQPMNFTWECWGDKRFEYGDFAQNIADLKAAHTSFRRMTDNFLRFNVSPGSVDWFDDSAFAVVLNNADLAGRVAKEGGCKGLMFDIEVYNEPLFLYAKQLHKDTRSFRDYEAKVRQRGQELIRAFSRYYPDITILLTYGYGITGLSGDRSKAQYGLLKNLLDGMLDAASGQTVIVDAYEGAYSFRARREFVSARKSVLKDMLRYTGNPKAYKKHMRVGFGVWMDNRYGAKAWNTGDFEKNYFLPEEFEYSVFCGLHVTDKYVWVYTEHPKWWTNDRLPGEYLAALKCVRNPRPIEDAKYTKRQVKDPPVKGLAAANQPGYSDEETFGDLKGKYEFLADLPKTWLFRADPRREGEKGRWFDPALPEVGWRSIEIGKFWDEQGIKYIGDAWYRVTWQAPDFPDNVKVVLWFGAVDETARVWVNGVRAGQHMEPPDIGWDQKFPIDVTGKLKPGQHNTIAVKVGNGSLAGGIWKSVKLAIEKY
ncbi:MAG: beta galactosidase jelly roll domain-containing protein [Armatimonadetes bacterium]|nr:beta galactosidase jelly roll domain-containing protein [Armatimonadota bacterium]